LFMDIQKRRDFINLSKLRAACGGANVYNWLFNLESSFNQGTMAWHNAEEPYVFHNAEYIETAYIPGVSEKLQDQVSGAWVNFARTGDPNHRGLPHWPAVKPDQVPTMLFDRTCEVRIDHDKQLIDRLPEVPWSFPGAKLMVAIFGIEPPAAAGG
jgi:para-nitrobenzyl esterase